MADQITVEEFRAISQRGGFDMIDVRSPNEFYELHAVGALLQPLDGLNPAAIMESRGDRRSEPLYVICRTGNRSAVACRLFEQAGFTNVINIAGGTLAWQVAGLPVNRGIRRPMSIERQIRLVSGIAITAASIAALASPWLLFLPGLIGIAMTWSAWTNNRSFGKLVSKLPWNRHASQSLPGGCGGCGSSGGCG
jgi:rhodanese-related sulfurtransferase